MMNATDQGIKMTKPGAPRKEFPLKKDHRHAGADLQKGDIVNLTAKQEAKLKERGVI